MMLAACGGSKNGGSSDTTNSVAAPVTTVSGVVSAGSPLSGTVYLKDSSEPVKEISKAVNQDGSYSIDVTGLTKPYILKAVAGTNATNANNHILYSFAADAGIANINPLSHLVVSDASNNKDLSALYYAPPSTDMQLIASGLAKAIQEMQTKLQPLLQAYGIETVNPISDASNSANHPGLDRMCDAIIIDISNGAVTITNRNTNAPILSNGTFTTENIPSTTTAASPVWRAAGSGLPGTKVNSLVIDPVGKILYAGTDSKGIFKSYSGADWSAVNKGLSSTIVYSLAIDPTDQSRQTIYAGTYSGVYKTIDGGGSWKSINNVESGNSDGRSNSLANTMIKTLAITPATSWNVFAGTTSRGVYRSYSSSASWISVQGAVSNRPKMANYSSLANLTINTLAPSPASPLTLYAGTYNNGVFKTTNGGDSWTALFSGLMANYTVNALTIDPVSQALYAGTNQAGIFKSTNSGESWNAVSSALTCYALIIDPVTQTIFAGTNFGVFKSTIGGSYGSWIAVNSGLPANTTVLSLAIDRQTLYAGTFNNGVYALSINP